MLTALKENELLLVKHSKDPAPLQSDFPMHAHNHFELLYFLSGDITYIVEGNSYTPQSGDILIFNIAETHRVVVNSNLPYERIVIQIDKRFLSDFDTDYIFSPFQKRQLGENNIISSTEFKDDLWKKCIMRLAENYDNSLKMLSFVLPLLTELRYAVSKEEIHLEASSLAANIVKYVNEHITEEITPQLIAKRFFISRTALYTLFREATGSGIHDYITVKRLIMAQNLLRQGEKPTKVYEKCGFSDYTTFFRAYKTKYKIPPKKEGKYNFCGV